MSEFGNYDRLLDDYHDLLEERDALQSLVRRLWIGEHVTGYDYDVATVEQFISSGWFGTHRGAPAAVSDAEAAALRSALER